MPRIERKFSRGSLQLLPAVDYHRIPVPIGANRSRWSALHPVVLIVSLTDRSKEQTLCRELAMLIFELGFDQSIRAAAQVD